jgi:hypothetical protein
MIVTREGDNINLSLNLADLDPPEQEFEADAMWAIVRRGAVSLLLDRLSFADESLVEARVEMRLSFEAFANFWASTQQEPFIASFRKWVERHPGTERAATGAETKAPPERAVLRAHVVRVSYVETDSELMFYGYPISAMSQVINQGANSVPMHGVLRVTCTTETLARFMAACTDVARQIPSRQGKGVSA